MKWENEIVQGDALELLRELPDACVDVVLTDPPYYKVVGEAWDRQWGDVWEFSAWCEAVGRELSRVLKPNGSLFWFCDEKMAAYAQVGLDKVFALVNCLVWHKGCGMGLKVWRELRGFAAWKLGLRYVCFERDGEYAARSQERMKGIKKQILLPFGADKQEQKELL